MLRCPNCQTPLEGPNNYCPSCHVSRPRAESEQTEARARASTRTEGTPRPAVRVPPLAACVAMDLFGMATYALPAFGEMADVVWAPISGLIFYFLFRRTPGVNGILGAFLATMEEILPMTDAIPTFTIAWIAADRARKRGGAA